MRSILILLCILGCTPPSSENIPSTLSQEVNSINYVKDNRTGLCFAVSYVGEYPIGSSHILSNVPCTPEVEKLIK